MTNWTEWAAIAQFAAAVALIISAWFLRASARQTKDLATKTKALADAADTQSTEIAKQAAATKTQADAVKEQAEAAANQLVLARQSLEVSVAPFLTIGEVVPPRLSESSAATESLRVMIAPTEPLEVKITEDELNAALVVRNVGNGLAIIRPGDSYIVGWVSTQGIAPDEYKQFNHAIMEKPVVLPQDQVTLSFTVPFKKWMTTFEIMTHSQSGTNPQLYFDVIYGPILANSQLTRVRLRSIKDDAGGWRVFEMDYFTPPEAAKPWPSVRFH